MSDQLQILVTVSSRSSIIFSRPWVCILLYVVGTKTNIFVGLTQLNIKYEVIS